MAKSTKKQEGEEVSKLQEVMNKMNALYGAGTIITGNQKSMNIKSVSTGSIKVDLCTGIGGLPYGRIVEVYGPESCGKTTLCIHTMVNAQRDLSDPRSVCLIDMEHAIHPQYMKDLGVDLDKLIVSQPMFGESAVEIAHQLMKAGVVKMIVIDSVTTLVPKAEIEGEAGDSKMAGIGRLMSQSLRTLNPLVEQTGTLLVYTNQLRDTPGVMYGNPSKPTGGNSLKFYASIRIEMTKSVGAAEKEKELNKTTVKVIKSKVSKPFQQCDTQILWGQGFNRLGEIIDLAEEYKILGKKGSWYTNEDVNLANGYDAMVEFLKDNPEMSEMLEIKVLEAINPPVVNEADVLEPVKEQ